MFNIDLGVHLDDDAMELAIDGPHIGRTVKTPANARSSCAYLPNEVEDYMRGWLSCANRVYKRSRPAYGGVFGPTDHTPS